jgi:hypothetical protein
VLCGNFAELSREKPKGFDEAYKVLIPWKDAPKGIRETRFKLGKATCDCVEIEEHYQPWYGFSWYHSRDCAISKHLVRYPGIQNFYWDSDPRCFGQSG